MSVPSRHRAPATRAAVPSFVPSYGPVRCYDADGNLLRVIAPAELVRRDLPDPRDTDALLPMDMPRKVKPRRHRGKPVRLYNVPKSGEWINYETVRPEKRDGRDWDF